MFVLNVDMKYEKHPRILPIIATCRQPNLFARALTMGAVGIMLQYCQLSLPDDYRNVSATELSHQSANNGPVGQNKNTLQYCRLPLPDDYRYVSATQLGS